MLGNNYLLWEDNAFIVCTPYNPHYPYCEGPIVVIKLKQAVPSYWQVPELTGKAFRLAANATKIMSNLQLAPWFNVQSNGNWGLLENASPFFHIYIYGRNKTERWAKPVVLPESPGTYNNAAMPVADRNLLTEEFKGKLS